MVKTEGSLRDSEPWTDILFLLQRLHTYWIAHRKTQARLRAEGSEPPQDAEFDGGFKVPGSIFSRLFDYQRTGLPQIFHCLSNLRAW